MSHYGIRMRCDPQSDFRMGYDPLPQKNKNQQQEKNQPLLDLMATAASCGKFSELLHAAHMKQFTKFTAIFTSLSEYLVTRMSLILTLSLALFLVSATSGHF